jgi:hypothetical protein
MKTLHKIILFFLFIILLSLLILLGKAFYPKPVVIVEKPKHAAGATSTKISSEDVENTLTAIPEPSTWLILGGMIVVSMAFKRYYTSTYKKDN